MCDCLELGRKTEEGGAAGCQVEPSLNAPVRVARAALDAQGGADGAVSPDRLFGHGLLDTAGLRCQSKDRQCGVDLRHILKLREDVSKKRARKLDERVGRKQETTKLSGHEFIHLCVLAPETST